MRKTILSILLILVGTIFVHGQRKSDLIAEIDVLRSQLDSVKSEVFDARKNEKVSLIEAESYKTQVTELQAANSTLMKNLNSFAEVSNKNSEMVNRAMTSLRAKEGETKALQEAISKHDSTALVVLTNVKQTLGEKARIGVIQGAVVISSGLANLFGSDTGTSVDSTAVVWVGKIADVLKANPETTLTIEGLSMTGDLNTPAQQALAVAGLLQSKFEIAPERITSLGKDGNLKEGVNFKIHPNYAAFYAMVRSTMKN